jgi:hypothetical protein
LERSLADSTGGPEDSTGGSAALRSLPAQSEAVPEVASKLLTQLLSLPFLVR